MPIHDQELKWEKYGFEPNLGAWLYDKVNGILNDACQATQRNLQSTLGLYDRAKIVPSSSNDWDILGLFFQQRCALDFKTLDLNQQYLTTEPM